MSALLIASVPPLPVALLKRYCFRAAFAGCLAEEIGESHVQDSGVMELIMITNAALPSGIMQ